MKKVIILLTLLSIEAIAQTSRTYRFFKKERTAIKKPFELRDPFVRKRVRASTSSQRRKRYGSSFSNRKQLSSIQIENLRIVGVFLGEKRKALAKIVENYDPDTGDIKFKPDVYILKEGMRVGENRAEIKAILPGGVVLVEKIKNVYEQDELLETIMPLYSSN